MSGYNNNFLLQPLNHNFEVNPLKFLKHLLTKIVSRDAKIWKLHCHNDDRARYLSLLHFKQRVIAEDYFHFALLSAWYSPCLWPVCVYSQASAKVDCAGCGHRIVKNCRLQLESWAKVWLKVHNSFRHSLQLTFPFEIRGWLVSSNKTPQSARPDFFGMSSSIIILIGPPLCVVFSKWVLIILFIYHNNLTAKAKPKTRWLLSQR